MSKVSMPRPRYIAFELGGAPVSRRALGNAIRGRARHEGWPDAQSPQLTRFAWPHGIVRVEHTEAARARELLGRVTWATEGDRADTAKLAITVRTLGTSGTLKALTGRLGILEKRDEPKPTSAAAAKPPRAQQPRRPVQA